MNNVTNWDYCFIHKFKITWSVHFLSVQNWRWDIYEINTIYRILQSLNTRSNISPSPPSPSVCQNCVWKQRKKTDSIGMFVLPSCLVKTYFAAVFVSHLSNWLTELLLVQENEKLWWIWVYFYCLFLPRGLSLRQTSVKDIQRNCPLAEVI